MSSVTGASGYETPNVEPVDTLRVGLGMVPPPASSTQTVHAVQAIQANLIPGTVAFKDALMTKAFGSHYMLRMQRERTALSQFRRAAGLPSSMIGLETSLGLRYDIDWSDVLNTPEKSERSVDVHVAMERRTDNTTMGWE